jgi:RNA polymerase sigma-70 factor (ECF subfamily)
VHLDAGLVRRLHAGAKGERWRLSLDVWATALIASADRALAGTPQTADDVARYLTALHLEDLALACACAAGSEDAWAHFMREYRPVLYRAADSWDPGGGARDIADALYAELYGDGDRQSLFRYFHGRSRLSTWLHSVMAQRLAAQARARKHQQPLPDDESPEALAVPPAAMDPRREHHRALMQSALGRAIDALEPRDRLRLGCYYAEALTLAEIGRILHEHEATASRQLARTRQTIKAEVSRQLRDESGLSNEAIADCFASIAEDAGPLDLRELIGSGGGPVDLERFRKKAVAGHSKKEGNR